MIGEKKEGLFTYNDFELLYLAKEGSEEAIEIILEKYKMLVFRLIKDFNVETKMKEDFIQEGLLMINKAINCYDAYSKMTFTKFVEMLIYRRFIDLMRKNKKETIVPIEKIDYIFQDVEKENRLLETSNFAYDNLSKFEYQVYQMKNIEGLTCKQISQKLDVNIKKVYSAVDRIKKKRRTLS